MKDNLLDENFETTPGPWTVESHLDTEGAYIVKQARHEQQIWGPAGYDISDEEGDRRDLIVERRNSNNVRLIQFAPEIFEALNRLLLCPCTGRKHAIEVMQSISPNWQMYRTAQMHFLVEETGSSPLPDEINAKPNGE